MSNYDDKEMYFPGRCKDAGGRKLEQYEVKKADLENEAAEGCWLKQEDGECINRLPSALDSEDVRYPDLPTPIPFGNPFLGFCKR